MTSIQRDPTACHAMIGALLVSPTQLPEVLATIRPDQLPDPFCEQTLACMAGLHRDGHPVTPQAIALTLRSDSLPRLLQLTQQATNAVTAEWYAQQALAEWRRWQVWQVGTRLTQTAETAEPDTDLLTEALRTLEHAADEHAASDHPPLILEDFLDAPDDPQQWVIPGLLERQDRLIWTGLEGLGKSVALRQIAVCAAAGVHPFTATTCPPQRVLVVDCENSERQDRAHYAKLTRTVQRHGYDPARRLALEVRPRGMDLTRDRDMSWLLRHAIRHQTDLLVIGPLYRLHAGDQNDERDARKLTAALDAVRERTGCAVVLEAHAPHGQPAQKQPRSLRPAGSSLWLRWPEFGLGIRPMVEMGQEVPGYVQVVGWRGPRSERDWPDLLRHGGDNTMPWITVGLPLRSVG